ncbi:MAG: serine/threonine protein kinase [Myxococcales bacterium]|nr:serine/threonine protein kinase [Myxococcales bacterium]
MAASSNNLGAADPDVDVDSDEDDDFELLATAAAPPKTLLTPGGQHPWQAPESLVGSLLGERYKLLRLIGQGGMGAVYLAEHVVIGKQIAVKVLGPEYSRNPGDVQRFLQEARAASLIRHDHVVDIADFGYSPGGQAYLVMEYLEGEDLGRTLQAVGAMPWFRASGIVMQIGSALAAAHAKGIVHRDMKPENCFRVKREGDVDFIKVLDFGIAKIVDNHLAKGQHSLTIEGGIIGTPEYIAPELCRGLKADNRVDIYALGIVMYRMVTGVLPFSTDTDNYMAVLSQHLTDAPVPPRQQNPAANIPPKIEQIILKALEKDPAHRYQKVEELIAALREAQMTLTGTSSTGILTTLPKLTRARTLRKKPSPMPLGLLLALAGVLLVGVVAIVWTLLGSNLGDAPPVAVTTPPAPPPPTQTPPTPEPPPPTPTPALAAATDTGEPTSTSTGDGDEAPAQALPDALSAADFRRSAAQIQRSLKASCPGLPGFEVGAKVYVDASGKPTRVVPEGRQAGSSFSNCVVKLIRQTRFKKARKDSVHSATFKL